MGALRSRAKQAVGLSALGIALGLTALLLRPDGASPSASQNLRSHSPLPQGVVIAGFGLPRGTSRLDGFSTANVRAEIIDSVLIAPRAFAPSQPVSTPVRQPGASTDARLIGTELLSDIRMPGFSDKPYAQSLVDADLAMPITGAVTVAALVSEGVSMSDTPSTSLLAASDPSERASVLVFGASSFAAASAGVGAPSIPASEEPFRLLSAARGTGSGPFGIGAPPSQALAGANPDAPQASPALGLTLAGDERGRQQKCLADAVYWESRSESRNGQIAVAQVVVNRALSGFYPKDLCGVVYQNAHRYLSCQFTFACEGRKALIPTETEQWTKAQEIAADMLDGKLWLGEVGSATHYHADYVKPWWARKMNKIKMIGAHIFYRPREWS